MDLQRLFALGDPPESEIHYECRRCGTTLDTGATNCPYCGPTDIVEIDLPE